ncbi:MAG: glutamine synthetase adenylyltransferase [Chloroflexi bacterium]|nr:glutamine synthetase adenylyltransferase [Chloroflexota bacterium]
MSDVNPVPGPDAPAEQLRYRLTRLLRSAEAQMAFAGLLPHLARAVADSASPARALANFERLAESAPAPAALFRALTADLRALEMLVTLFAASQYLADILLRQPAYLDPLMDRAILTQFKSQEQFAAGVRAAFQETGGRWQESGSGSQPPLDALRRYQRAELLRIGACDLYGLMDLASVTAQLSHLADAIVQACLEAVAGQLGIAIGEFAVLGMGKLGGGELNYSSDIDLLFISAANATAYTRLGTKLIEALTQATGEGFLYRVDMRLRPWGQVGPLVTTLEGYLTYLKRHARLWEKQALLKARPIAGNLRVGETFLRSAQSFIFTADPESVRADVHAMKQQTEAHLHGQGRHWGEVKLGEGSIRDVEFVAQYLQLTHGARRPGLLTPNTLTAVARLAEGGLLTREEQRVLTDGYVFLRTVEHYLQMLDYRQIHTLPQDAAGLAYLARRLGFIGPDAAARFIARYEQHSAAIRAVYSRHLAPLAGGPESVQRGAKPMTSQNETRKTQDADDQLPASSFQSPASSLQQHLSRLSPSYAATFSEAEIARHAGLAELLNDHNPIEVIAEPLEGVYWRVTIVAYDYLGELAVICGLLFAYGLSIVDGHVYTYEAATDDKTQNAKRKTRSPASNLQSPAPDARRKIVDVFTVRSVHGETMDIGALWRRYATDLAALLRLLAGQRPREAQGELAKRIALGVRGIPVATPTLHPIDIEIDNDASDRYTILRIGAPDTIGFLYEFSNALALNDVHIAQVAVATVGARVLDTLYITDTQGRKIIAAERQRELRAATVLVKHFTHLLPHSPNPETALLHFHEYLGELFRRPSWPDELASLERPEVLQALARLLGVSEFLWEDFLRMQHANLFPVVRDLDALAAPKTKKQLAEELAGALTIRVGEDVMAGTDVHAAHDDMAPTGENQDGWIGGFSRSGGQCEKPAKASSPEPRKVVSRADWRDTLNAFKDREMFRVDMRHIQGYIRDMAQFSAELSDLAEVTLDAAFRLCEDELRCQYGAPRLPDGDPCPMTVCALGKCGGRELGFASDIELMFVYSGSGETTGPKTISAAEYYDKLVREVVRAIRARREGIFEIDLQLRPYGAAGSLAVPLDSFRRYFAPGGPAWGYERQALIKLRPIAGDASLGEQVAALRDEFVYSGAGFDVVAMRAMRERQLRHLVTAGTINAKFSQGGLVDVEYVVQGLQIAHGHSDPSLRLTNTREAMMALAQAGLISAENYARLREAHTFLLRLIDALRVVRGNAKDLTVPQEDSEDFAFLARRLGYGDDPLRLRADLMEHVGWVQRLSTRLLG